MSWQNLQAAMFAAVGSMFVLLYPITVGICVHGHVYAWGFSGVPVLVCMLYLAKAYYLSQPSHFGLHALFTIAVLVLCTL